MKNIIYIATAILSLAFLSFSCEKYQDDISTPSLKISVSPENPKVGDEITIKIETNGQYLSLFTGDKGHDFKRSRIKAIIENDWESFKDTCYKVSLSKPGQKATWYRYFKDYKTMDEVRKDFDFFGAIKDVQLVKCDNDAFPESLIGMSYPGENILKLTVTDRRIPSGITFKPHIHIMSPINEQGGNSIIESRFVACDADRAIHIYSHRYFVPSWWGVHTEQTEAHEDYPKGYTHESVINLHNWGVFPTNDPLSGRPTEGFYKLGEFFRLNDEYIKKFTNHSEKLEITQIDLYFTKQCTNFVDSTSTYHYDLDGNGVDEYYECELDSQTGLPVNPSDYHFYSGFQGDVYLSYLEIGSEEYEPWNTGVALGSIYAPVGMTKTYKYTYKEAGKFEITAVAANIGNKQHKGIDYTEDRGNSLNNYPAKRTVASVKVNVLN